MYITCTGKPTYNEIILHTLIKAAMAIKGSFIMTLLKLNYYNGTWRAFFFLLANSTAKIITVHENNTKTIRQPILIDTNENPFL